MHSGFHNLTPHAVTVGGVVIPPSGQIARVAVTRTPCGTHNGVPLFLPEFGEVVGLPAPVSGVIFVVSALVRGQVPNRGDVASPGNLLRDGSGNVIGADGLDVNAGVVL